MRHSPNRLKRTQLASRLFIASLAALTAYTSYATDGYFDFGYGVKSKGIGGAGVAFPQDALAPATNPAGLAFIENRLDIGVTYFNPDRLATLGGREFSGNETSEFFIPDISFKRSLSEKVDVGLALYGNGGMNTDYSAPLFDTGSEPAFHCADAVLQAHEKPCHRPFSDHRLSAVQGRWSGGIWHSQSRL